MNPVQATEYINCANLQHEQLVVNGERSFLARTPQHPAKSGSTSINLNAHTHWLTLAATLLILVLVAASV